MSNDLIEWLSEKLKERGWSMRELSRRADISYTSVANVLSGERDPTWGFCASIAGPFDEPPINLFRMAGLLGDIPEDDITLQELIAVIEGMDIEQRMEVIRYARYLLKEGRK